MAIQNSWQIEIGYNLNSPSASLKLDPNGSLYANWIEQDGAVVAMFNNSGQIVWRKQGLLGSIGSIDSDYLYFAATLENVYPQVPFVSKYNKEGGEVWKEQLIFSGTGVGADAAVSNDGSLYLVGGAYGGIGEIADYGGGDSFIAKYDKYGDRQWVTLVGTSKNDIAYSVATSKDGAIFVVGQEGGSYMLRSGRGYLAKFNADGTLQWQRQISSDQPTSAEKVVVSQEGDVYIAGQQAAGREDLLFISKYTSQGELIWKRTLDVSPGNNPISLQIDDTGSVYSSVKATIVKLDRDGKTSWEKSIGVGFTTIEEMVVDKRGEIYAIVHATNWIGQPEVDAGIFLAKYVPSNGNAPPVDLTSSTSAFNENIAYGSTIATLSTTDPDTGDTFTYALVSGTGSTDNSAFTISDNQLRINSSPDIETKNSYSIRVRTTDQGGLSFEKQFTLNIQNLPETPRTAALSLNSTSMQLLYVAYYGRPGDTGGLQFWQSKIAESGFSYAPRAGDGLTDIERPLYDRLVVDFGDSFESQRLYVGKSLAESANAVYQYCFGRDAEVDPITGENYWVGKLWRKEITLSQLAAEVALGSQGSDLTFFQNRIEAANLFFQAMDTPAEQLGYSTDNDNAIARDWLLQFGFGSATSSLADQIMTTIVATI